MNEIIEVKTSVPARDIDVITSEIHELCRQAQATACAYIVEIGRRLAEAKAQLDHGEWGPWLKERVGFSQSTANNYMKIYEEYGASQMTIFGAVANSQTIGNLPYSKALALLAVPSEEREKFAEKVDVENLSVKELERAIKERDEERRRAEKLAKTASEVDTARAELKAAAEKVERLREQLFKKEEELASEKQTSGNLRAELKDAKADPKIPKKKLDEMKEKIRAELQSESDGESEDLKRALADAEAAKVEAETKKAEAEARLKEAEAKLKLSDPDVGAFKVMFDNLQAQAAKCKAQLEKIRKTSPEVADKLAGAMRAFGGTL